MFTTNIKSLNPTKVYSRKTKQTLTFFKVEQEIGKETKFIKLSLRLYSPFSARSIIRRSSINLFRKNKAKTQIRLHNKCEYNISHHYSY